MCGELCLSQDWLVRGPVNHHRVPIILTEPKAMKLWLDPKAEPKELKRVAKRKDESHLPGERGPYPLVGIRKKRTEMARRA